MKTPEILKIFTKHEFNEYNCPFFKSEDIVNIANELEQAISVTRCCKSDSELLLFSADEIVSKINEQTVLDGETFRVYFCEK
jgi:hypothetical protein